MAATVQHMPITYITHVTSIAQSTMTAQYTSDTLRGYSVMYMPICIIAKQTIRLTKGGGHYNLGCWKRVPRATDSDYTHSVLLASIQTPYCDGRHVGGVREHKCTIS